MASVEEVLKEKIYTITQVAALLGVSYTMARNIILENKIKYVKIGKQILIPESEVRKLIELRKQKIINKIRVRGER